MRLEMRNRRGARGKLDLLLVGPYPPPLGGVSSHVSQVAHATATAGYRVGVLDHFGGRRATPPVLAGLRRNPGRYVLELSRHRAELVHVHYAGRPTLLVASALARRRRTSARWLLTVHNQSLGPMLKSGGVRSRLLRWALNQFDEIIAVSAEVSSAIAPRVPNRAMSIVPAYAGVAHGDGRSVSRATSRLLDAPGVALVVAGYRIRPIRGGGDLYGIDVAARVFAELAAEHPLLKLVVFLAHPPRGWPAKRYLGRIQSQLHREWPGRTHVAVGEQLAASFAHRAVYLRPSRTDGDAVSVREALECGIPVIASDATSRPGGVRAVALADVGSWVRAVREAIVDVDAHEQPTDTVVSNDDLNGSLPTMLALYRRHLDSAPRGTKGPRPDSWAPAS